MCAGLVGEASGAPTAGVCCLLTHLGKVLAMLFQELWRLWISSVTFPGDCSGQSVEGLCQHGDGVEGRPIQ